ncbi:MAG: hypothetical protein ACYCVW_16615 [Rhodocyclaceae bacterium]
MAYTPSVLAFARHTIPKKTGASGSQPQGASQGRESPALGRCDVFVTTRRFDLSGLRITREREGEAFNAWLRAIYWEKNENREVAKAGDEYITALRHYLHEAEEYNHRVAKILAPPEESL